MCARPPPGTMKLRHMSASLLVAQVCVPQVPCTEILRNMQKALNTRASEAHGLSTCMSIRNWTCDGGTTIFTSRKEMSGRPLSKQSGDFTNPR